MKVLLTIAGPVGSVPAPYGSGAAMFLWGIAHALLSRGHQVGFCYTPITRLSMGELETLKKKITQLNNLNINVDVTASLPSRSMNLRNILKVVFSIIRPQLSECYPAVALASEMRRVVEARSPDVVYWNNSGMLVAMRNGPMPPSLVMTGDLDHDMIYYHWRLTPICWFKKYIARFMHVLAARSMHQFQMQLLSSCDSVVTNAYHTVDFFRDHGVACSYIPMGCASVDVGPVCLQTGCVQISQVPRILMLGHLTGTATQLGLQYLGTEIIPALEQRLGPSGFEIHICGQDKLPGYLLRRLQHPAVRLRGYVSDVAVEYASADVVLSTTPVRTGARTRIAEAFSMGAAVVAHVAESAGMPEIVHGRNALLGAKGTTIADHIVRLAADQSLRKRLGVAARETYDTYYAPSVSIEKLVDELEWVEGRRLKLACNEA